MYPLLQPNHQTCIDTWYHFSMDQIAKRKDIEVEFYMPDDQVAEVLTKLLLV